MDINDRLYFSDLANAAVFTREQPSEKLTSPQMQILIKDYEGMPLKGPTSLYYKKSEDSLLICDAGYFGTTSLTTSTGSLYIMSIEDQTCRSVLLNCLSYPADVIWDENGYIYLVETFANRVLRLVQGPNGVYHASVFHQFFGRLGPTAIAIDAIGNIYVARYEFQTPEKDVDGLISVLSKEGSLIGELVIPKLPEITGMCCPGGKIAEYLFITEKSYYGVFKVNLNQMVTEVNKILDMNKNY